MKFASIPKFSLLLIAGVFVLAMAGCGGTNTLGLTQGNWAFSATSTAPTKLAVGPTFVVGGSLTQNGDKLTGTMYISQSGCIVPQFVNFTGTVKGKNVTFTSASFGGQVISVAASGTKDSLTGTYTVTGECADSGTVAANAMPSISGTWNGLVNPIGPPPSSPQGISQATLSIALTQATSPSEDGTFALSGTVTFTNSSCSVSGTITSGSIAGTFIPVLNVDTLEQGGGTGSFQLANAHLDSSSTPTNFTGDYDVTGGLCQGNLTEEPVFTKQ